jgi:phage shock protein A
MAIAERGFTLDIGAALSRLDDGSALASFERLEHEWDLQEARESALVELESYSVGQRFLALEAGERVMRELAKLTLTSATGHDAAGYLGRLN